LGARPLAAVHVFRQTHDEAADAALANETLQPFGIGGELGALDGLERRGQGARFTSMRAVELLFNGIVIGFFVAAPVGPSGLLCIRRTLLRGRLAGFASGLGAAAADTAFAVVAVFGVTLIADLLSEHRALFALGGGFVLIWLGLMEWRARPPTAVVTPVSTGHLVRSFVSTFLLTLMNPLTIVTFVALFAGLGVAEVVGDTSMGLIRRYFFATELIVGVFIGAAGWWLTLTSGVHAVRHHFEESTLRWMPRISGAGLVLFGLYAVTLTWR
jgi:threonine/homoserine/homoserine lactone efflux protein